jgi:hypothetical protein
MKIKNRYTGEVIFENDADTMRQTVIDANLRGANLGGAYLSDADLSGADLRGTIGVYSFGPLGENGRVGYAVDSADGVMIALGCFWGNEEAACIAIRKKYGENSLYEEQVKLAVKILKEK